MSQSSSQTINEENGQDGNNNNDLVLVRKSYNTLGLSILCISVASFVIQTVIKKLKLK